MDVIGRWVLVPLSLGALTSGIVQSIGTKWGLVRHYWVLVKLLLTTAATAVLLLHQFTAVEEAARVATQTTAEVSEPLRRFALELLADAGLAAVVLTFITAISIYKPWGSTSFRKAAPAVRSPGTQRWSLRLLLGAIIALIAAFVTLHLNGRSHHHSHGH
ncbi:MAG: putative rane protein [Polyangiaceae bacterium]|nr:putative rane protein [Polyangiaceae bacterium]